MKLQAWLDKNGKSRKWFGEQFQPEPVKPQTVDGWCEETPRMPNRRFHAEIERITKGKVTAKDFI